VVQGGSQLDSARVVSVYKTDSYDSLSKARFLSWNDKTGALRRNQLFIVFLRGSGVDYTFRLTAPQAFFPMKTNGADTLVELVDGVIYPYPLLIRTTKIENDRGEVDLFCTLDAFKDALNAVSTQAIQKPRADVISFDSLRQVLSDSLWSRSDSIALLGGHAVVGTQRAAISRILPSLKFEAADSSGFYLAVDPTSFTRYVFDVQNVLRNIYNPLTQ